MPALAPEQLDHFAREGYAWLMSGGAISTQSVPNPATVAALETQPEASLQENVKPSCSNVFIILQ